MSRKILVMLWQPPVEQTASLALQHKLQILEQALNTAYTQFQESNQYHSHNEAPLLFVGPEHFFVDRDYCAYSEAQKRLIQEHLALWSKKWPRSILLPGTLKWQQCAPKNSAVHRDAIQAFKTVGFQHYKDLNQDPLQQPGWDYTTTAADRQFIFNTSLIFYQGQCFEYSKQTDCNELNATENQQATFCFGTQPGFIEIAGFRFGFEICSDHDHRILRKQIESGELPVDIHIVQSKGLPSLVDAMACHPNGIYVHCDHFASVNSLVLSFQNGIGTESRSLGKAPEHGLIWWEVSTKPMSPDEQLSYRFTELCVTTLRKQVLIIPPKYSPPANKRI